MRRPFHRLLPVLLGMAMVLLLGLSAMAGPSNGRSPAWVELNGHRVLEIRVAAGAQRPAEAAARVSHVLRQIADNPQVSPEQIVVVNHPPYWVVAQQRPDGALIEELAVDARAADSFGLSQQALAERYRDKLRAAIVQYRTSNQPRAWLLGTALALLVLVVYLLWVRWQRRCAQRLRTWVRQRSPGLRLGTTPLLEPGQLRGALLLAVNVGHWALLLLISYLLIPLLLGFFPPTQVLAAGLRGQLLNLVMLAWNALLGAVPNLAVIAVIGVITTAVVRLSNSWFTALEQERIQLRGFYPEWAKPTSRIVTLLLVLGGVVLALPYIPGSGSKAFQGAGLFVGVLAALGSSAVASNVISGVMLIYTREFREGDRVEINGVVGVVQERALLVTRIRTPRNELVSVPNATVIGSSVVNFSQAEREISQPVALGTSLTLGYDVPWRQVHALLIAAARSVPGISEKPEPWVLQTSLNDFHITYELNASVADVGRYRETLSELLAAIQDQFAAAGVEIMSPSYQVLRAGLQSTIPQRPNDEDRFSGPGART